MYIFQLMDYYSASGMSLLWVCFFQTVALSWIFGVDKLCDCIEQMMGFRPNIFWRICWRYSAPLSILVQLAKLNQITLSHKKSFNFSDYLYKSMCAIPKTHLRKWLQLSPLGGCDWYSYQFIVNDVDSSLRFVLRSKRIWHGTREFLSWHQTSDQGEKALACSEEGLHNFRE